MSYSTAQSKSQRIKQQCIKLQLYGMTAELQLFSIYASNEPKSVLARDLGDCRDNLRKLASVLLIVSVFD